MASASSLGVLRDIRTLFDAGTAAGLTDRQLLERFGDRRDLSSDAAFEVLILRHGPMVLRVCRNLLRDDSDAWDAFQATFLVLVRRRESLRRLESVGGWLYGVACRVAARARVDAARRKRFEQQGALRVVEAVDAEDEGSMTREFGPVVQEEVRRLPERYRAAVVLCYWQSLTHEQAAAQLGCPLGTVRSRLARARKLLHRRLTRRGLTPLAAVVALGLGESRGAAALEAVPPALIKETIRSAARVASGHTLSYAASGATVSLVQRTLWSLVMVKLKTAAFGLAMVVVVGYGGSFATHYITESRVQRTVAANQTPTTGRTDPDADRTGGRKSAKAQSQGAKAADFFCTIQSRTTIVRLLRDGSSVTKGQLVCELDSAVLKDSLTNQRITTESAKANHGNAKLAREEAEFDARTYADDLFPREQKEIQAELDISKAELSVAEERLNATKAIGGNNKLEIMEADLAIARAKLAITKAGSRLHILTDYTHFKKTRELTRAIERARSEELAKQAVVELELTKEKKLENQIVACKIVAPFDGVVVYHRELGGPTLEEGSIVHSNQRLFRVVTRAEADPIKP
jgi:RNA polymerase sigma factor (sigma-70 family)